jgi:regulator of cell morphogenesis and NO signaling
VRKTLPDLRSFSTKVASVHGENHPELYEISRLVEQVCQELSEHMVSEETILFQYVKHLVAAKNNNSASVKSVKFENYDCIQTPIDMLEMEHDAVGNSLETIRELSNNYTLPEDSCASYSYLYNTLVEFESDLFIHIHLENNILFPKAIEMEKEIG